MAKHGGSARSSLLRRPSERRRAAFTLIELLVVIAIILTLAALLLPALNKAKEEGKSISCRNNLHQLQLCWHMYADDYSGVMVPNDWIAMLDGGSAMDVQQTSWCEGNARTDTDSSSIQKGLLFPYDKSPGIYRCPSDLSTIVDQFGNPLPQLRTRSYNMSQSVNGYPFFTNQFTVNPFTGGSALVNDFQPCFSKYSSITNPPPSGLFVFIDENEGTLFDDQFGYPMIGTGSEGFWWDMPSNRHNQGANLSFADGHVEHWRWKKAMICDNPPGDIQDVSHGGSADYTRMGKAMRQKRIDWVTP